MHFCSMWNSTKRELLNFIFSNETYHILMYCSRTYTMISAWQKNEEKIYRTTISNEKAHIYQFQNGAFLFSIVKHSRWSCDLIHVEKGVRIKVVSVHTDAWRIHLIITSTFCFWFHDFFILSFFLRNILFAFSRKYDLQFVLQKLFHV